MTQTGTGQRAGQRAAEFTGTLWAAITLAGGTRPAAPRHHHVRAAYDPAWLAGLPLPAGPARPGAQPVALLDDGEQFERHRDPAALAAAYTARPRTRVYEHINYAAPGTWYTLAACHLGRLACSDREVTCSLFESAAGDVSLDAHHDTWYAAIVQMDGAKTWTIGQCLLGGTGTPEEITTTVGDILILPKGLPHRASTPADPGRSAHLAFAIHRDSPLARGAGTASTGHAGPGPGNATGRTAGPHADDRCP